MLVFVVWDKPLLVCEGEISRQFVTKIYLALFVTNYIQTIIRSASCNGYTNFDRNHWILDNLNIVGPYPSLPIPLSSLLSTLYTYLPSY